MKNVRRVVAVVVNVGHEMGRVEVTGDGIVPGELYAVLPDRQYMDESGEAIHLRCAIRSHRRKSCMRMASPADVELWALAREEESDE